MKGYDLNDLQFIGNGLSRPECSVAHSSGMVFVPDWTGDGGVSLIYPDGQTKRHLARNWKNVSRAFGFDEPLRPNGICLLENGSFLLAHLGAMKGGVFRLDPDGTVAPFLLEIDGVDLPPTNFVIADNNDRVWVTVSTRTVPRADAYRRDVADGFIALIDRSGARIVADQMGYTNECVPHPDGQRLFVNETFSRRLTSFDVELSGDLSNRKTIATMGAGTYPDGLAFDENGHCWLTSIVSNRLLCIDDSGDSTVYFEDVDAEHLDWVETAWKNNSMGRPHLDKAAGQTLRNISNLSFCGENLDHAVMGCLLDQRLPMIKMPVRGYRPVHWTFDVSPLVNRFNSQPAV